MAGGKSYYLAVKVLDHAVGKASFTMPATVYMALCTVTPTANMTGSTITEPTSGASQQYVGYTRTTSSTAMGSAASPGTTSNTTAITFPAVGSGSTGVAIVGFALVDASSAGNMLYWGTITSKTVDTNNTPPTVGIGALVITEA